MLRFALCLVSASFALSSFSQSGITYVPGESELFIFKADSLKEAHDREDFQVRTVVNFESYAFVDAKGNIVGRRGNDQGDDPFAANDGARPANAAPLLNTFYCVPTPADTIELPWKPKLIMAVTAN